MFDINKDNLLKDFIKFPKKNLLFILLFLGFGEWFVSDLIHFAGGSIGFFALCLGGYFYLKNDKPKFNEPNNLDGWINLCCLLYTSPSPRDLLGSRMPSSA